jgi:hypothetical protein
MATRTYMAAAIALALALAGCGDAGERGAAAAHEREWDALAQSRRDLDVERARLAVQRGRLAGVPIDAGGTPLLSRDAALAAEVATRERALAARSAALEDRLVRLADAPGTDEEARARAIRLKSDEDVAIAQEWIERGGDYRRAIEILEMQRHVDPGYGRLEGALARARQMRFVTAERLARVQPGMTPIEVRSALGPVNLREVLRRPEERLQAWYYPEAGGGRAAVYFRYDGERRGFVVYQTELVAGAGAGRGAAHTPSSTTTPSSTRAVVDTRGRRP